MLHLQRLLFPTDHSACADRALGHALAFAWTHEAELHVLTARAPMELNAVLEDAPARVSQMLPDTPWAKPTALAQPVKVVEVEEMGLFAADTILHYAEEHAIDLIVMGTHGRRGMQRMLQGSVTEQVVREAKCPVLSLRCDDHVPPEDALDRLLVPVDFSDPSRQAVRYAEHLARTFDAEIELVHVVGDLMWPEVYEYDQGIYTSAHLGDRARTALEAMAQSLRADGLACQVHVRYGYPVSEILRAAEDLKASLIVMPTHGLTGLQHFLIGSVAEKVVRMAPCPVFVMKPFGKNVLV